MTKTYNLTEPEFDLLIVHYLHSLLVARDVKCDSYMSVNDFRNQNERAIYNVSEMCKDDLGYTVTYEQINKAISIYFASRKCVL